MIAAQSAALGAIPVMQAQLGEYNEKFTRAFNSIRAAQDTANDAAKRTEFHSNVFKGVWVLVIASLGLIGWGWNQLERARERDAAMDRRVLLTEYKLGIIPVAEGGKQ